MSSAAQFARLEEPPQRRGWLDVVADPVRLHILRSLSGVSEATATDLIARGPASGQTVRRHLDDLVAVGVVEERPGESDGETPGRPAARFSLHPEVRVSVESTFRFFARSARAPRPARRTVPG